MNALVFFGIPLIVAVWNLFTGPDVDKKAYVNEKAASYECCQSSVQDEAKERMVKDYSLTVD